MSLYDYLSTAGWLCLLFYVLWYFLLTDSDTILAFSEAFGRPVSSFKGKVIWVTGASSGLGEAIAHELASVGAKLILSARNEDMLEQVKKACLERSEGKLEKKDILVLPFDICDLDVHRTKVENAINHFEKIDVLINNAGRYQIGAISNTQTDVMKDLFQVNFFGGVNLTKLVLNHFLDKGKGHIVVVSSVAGKFGPPAIASYTATKHALQGFYETLRMEYHSNNIGVTIVNPGIFKSDIFSRTMGANKGEIFQKDLGQYECAQMTSARCAHLTLIAAANKLFESWIAYQPTLFGVWASQYFPDIYKYVMLKLVYSKRRVEEFRSGVWPDDMPVWRPLFRFNKQN